MTTDTLQKLEDAFLIDATDKEACFYAGISTSTLYAYQGKNPEFLERKEGLRTNVVLRARKTICDHLNDPRIAQWFLERKRPDEFNQRLKLEHSGSLQNKTEIADGSPLQCRMRDIGKKYEEELRQEIVNDIKSRHLLPTT